MRFITLLFAATLLFSSCDKLKGSKVAPAAVDGSVDPNVPNMPKTTLSFENDTFDFGHIKEGSIVEHTFVVKNTGKEPLLITNCKASCGCTIPTWPKDPINVGETAKIEVKFNSTHKEGEVSKAVTVTANTEPAQNFLTIKGFVEKTEEAPKK